MVTFIFVRHGESKDNTRSLWAGWRDAPLTNHGMSQARALGEAFATIHFKALHCSDLKRTIMTADAIHGAQMDPKPTRYSSMLLREQNYGSAEGKRWDSPRIDGLTLEEHYSKGMYPVLRGRSKRFPGGESLEDLEIRAERVIDEILMPYVRDEADGDAHIAIVSHGNFLSELVAALVKRDKPTSRNIHGCRGMKNTGWTRVVVTTKGLDPEATSDHSGLELVDVRVTQVNNHDHLLPLKRQRGGIGSSVYDPQQKDIRGFFRGTRRKKSSEGRGKPNYRE
ncbi:phosphoglycerate mutase-like protein [Macrolepiota fuliginosa MF-IS2]|uniref:Phosphoglycerate mutase-like protein n=1 Tax=Macrolepiota fuliginosa MF-IS2 TaxID=1400762 RepID=A0A9P5XPS2_9AGAR|nr:phosphoglycerate mutase-like protein [Macrolepiota fuliginosa MF-IS2]